MEIAKKLSFPIQCCKKTKLKYTDIIFEVFFKNSVLMISIDDDNYLEIRQKNQQVPYKATILGGFALKKKIVGNIDHTKYFRIIWDDDTLSMPILMFLKNPEMITREYWKGGSLELGVGNERDYLIKYKDGIEAKYIRNENGSYEFFFSSGFFGSIKKEEDGSHTINFKGDVISPEENGFAAVSKFIISRSKYTNNLILYFQEDAEVTMKLM